MNSQLLWPDTLSTHSSVAGDERAARQPLVSQEAALTQIERLNEELHTHFHEKLLVDTALTRQMVSFQANKNKASYRWYKFKEAFSAPLIEYLLHRYGIEQGKLLDPFAGSGTALFVARDQGLDADGIEVLPSSQALIEARLLAEQLLPEELAALRLWADEYVWEKSAEREPLLELRITLYENSAGVK